MRIRYLAACMSAAALVASPSAFSDPGNGRSVARTWEDSDVVGGGFCDATGTLCGFFAALASIPRDTGEPPFGQYFVQAFDEVGNIVIIFCTGPEYAQTVSVNPQTGESSVNATLDPSAPSCVGSMTGPAFTISLSGTAAKGTYNSSSSAASRFEDGKLVGRAQSKQIDYPVTTLTGSIGFLSGTFNGAATTVRFTQFEK